MSSDFSEDDGYVRGDDSLCQSPSGTVAVRDGLLIASFVLSLLVLSGWLVCLTTVKCANPPSSQGYESTNQNEWVWYRESKFNHLSSPGSWA